MMSKIYIGNLSNTVTEDILRNLFTDNLSLGDNRLDITLKKGYAFVDCQDSEIAQKAVTAFNGYNLMSSIMQVEPAVSRRRKSNRVQLKQLPPHISKDDINSLISNYGTVQRFEIVTNSIETIVHITYETPDQAQQAVEQLNNLNFQGSSLKAEFMSMGGNGGGRSFRGANGDGRGPRPYGLGAMNGNKHQGAGYPLRILVPSEYVGAIIGRKGAAIREITTQCKARVDVHGKENSGLLEKVISIFGQPENCTSACKEILRVMQQEANTTGKGEIILKMLADDRFCGRIIGKEGKVIKKIREDTNTKITVSNVQEAPAIFPDRVVTIRGAVDNMSAAEAVISAKLRECHERDVQNPNAQGLMLPPNPMMPMMVDGVYGMRPPFGLPNQNYYPGGLYGTSGHMQQAAPASGQPQPEVCSISVPNSAVGALIGSGGVNIKQIIRESGAYVAIEPKKDDDGNPGGERTVTVKGSPEALWKASFLVFDKLKQEGFAGTDDVRLRTAIKVPKAVVGRVIGKSGKNVREIQHTSGAMIKLPESQATQGEEVTVEIFGNFFATQNAQSRIRALVKQSSVGVGGPNGSGGVRRPRMYDGGAPAGAVSAVSAASQIPVI